MASLPPRPAPATARGLLQTAPAISTGPATVLPYEPSNDVIVSGPLDKLQALWDVFTKLDAAAPRAPANNNVTNAPSNNPVGPGGSTPGGTR